MRRLVVGVAPFAVVVAVYFAVVALSSPDEAGDTGSTTTLTPSSTTTSTVGSAPGEGAWDALPSHHDVEVHAYLAVLAAIPVPHEPVVVTAPATPVPPPVGSAFGPVGDGGSIATFLACTRAHESDTAGGYQAVSPSGAHRGAYQFVQSTWDTVAGWVGRPDLVGVPPDQASPADQDLLAAELYRRQGNRPWGGRC